VVEAKKEVALLKLPRLVEDAEKRALTINECNTLIDAATNARLAMMYKTLIATGMRGSELIGLLWTMIDWERCEIKLTSQLKRLKPTKRNERLLAQYRPQRKKKGGNAHALPLPSAGGPGGYPLDHLRTLPLIRTRYPQSPGMATGGAYASSVA